MIQIFIKKIKKLFWNIIKNMKKILWIGNFIFQKQFVNSVY